ncbi:hypothetical protein U9M48_013891 [Paspalum notatum var. saurae]|uniref:Reverse transcriptase domain-containing protein n=1 Tax=Paspalum notatum var. saurae TaxID=547442 RepID=A0AAQ3T0G0_PASNO
MAQEEVLVGNSICALRRGEISNSLKYSPRVGVANTSVKAQEYRDSEEKWAVHADKSKHQGEKVSALMAYRKAKGLCFKCGTKWGSQHKCPSSVSLHVVEELWQMVSEDSSTNEICKYAEDTDSGDELMALSAQAVSGTATNKTIKLYGHIHCYSALMLVDSGSSYNFISEQFAAQLKAWRPLPKPIQVKVADGGILLCTHEINQQFYTTFKILPLKCYDAILGIEWLEQFSPMTVQWAEKWFTFCHQGKPVKLQGLLDSLVQCKRIDGDQFHALTKTDEIWCVVQAYVVDNYVASLNDTPSAIQDLIHEYPTLYTPFQKTEIEQQAAKLLQNKMITESTSPFASPVLLVKKKSGEWRLCVDYRRLNAHTVKNKFPMPIIEELFEELAGATWFTTLDLRSGFHQIAMLWLSLINTRQLFRPILYKVMPYGLTGAPATFQATMNYILATLLRKCVVVFIDDILVYSRTFEEHLTHLQAVFVILQQHHFKIRLSKCSFAQQLKYLGHIISANGVATDPE